MGDRKACHTKTPDRSQPGSPDYGQARVNKRYPDE